MLDEQYIGEETKQARRGYELLWTQADKCSKSWSQRQYQQLWRLTAITYQNECRCSARNTKHKQHYNKPAVNISTREKTSWSPCDSDSASRTLKVWNHLTHTLNSGLVKLNRLQTLAIKPITYESCLNSCKHCTMEGLAQASNKASPVIQGNTHPKTLNSFHASNQTEFTFIYSDHLEWYNYFYVSESKTIREANALWCNLSLQIVVTYNANIMNNLQCII